MRARSGFMEKNRIGKGMRLLALVIILTFPMVLSSCSSKDEDAARRLLELESKTYEGRGEDARIRELKEDVARYRKIVEQKVAATEKLGNYYKMLALAYIDRNMYGEALEALDGAVRIYPEQANLFLFKGIAAGRLSKALSDPAEIEALRNLSEQAYLRCLDIDPGVNQALYGLAVLYAFEMERPKDAIPLLEKLLLREKQNVDALFLLALCQYSLGYSEDALTTYDRIIDTPAAGARREEARKNKKLILEGAVR
jgi:cytochrome c-type biogenesis protein CcmH/NrfG